MNIALSFPGCHRRGGVERVVYECASFLGSKGHRVLVYTSDSEVCSAPGVEVCNIPKCAGPDFIRAIGYYLRCSTRVRSNTCDVLSTHGVVCPTGGVHWVQSVHRAWLERSRSLRRAFSRQRLLQIVNPFHIVISRLEQLHFRCRKYRKVIATTEQVRRDLGRLYGVPEGDVVIIPNGYSPSEFSFEERIARRKRRRADLGLQKDCVVMLFAANELARKGYSTILQAMRLVRDPRLVLLVVGRGNAQAAKDGAAKYGLSHQVLVCGSTDKMADFHAASDFFVLPTQYEAFSLAILEALGSGLPVVTSDVAGARDAIIHGSNGSLLSNPQDAVELARSLREMLDSKTREAMAMRCSDSVREYRWPSVLLRYEGVLRENCYD